MRNRKPLRPRVTAIVPSHGHRRFLPARLKTITGQILPPDELVIIDDGSTDGSAEWLRSWRSELSFRLECRSSATGNPFAVWNAGASRASGDWLWIAESDDSCQPQFLATLLAAAERHPDAAIIFCQSELMDAEGATAGTFADYTRSYDSESWRLDFALAGGDAAKRHLLARNTIPNVSACLISRRAWVAAGGADTSLNLCGDWLTYARLLRHGSLVFCAEALNQHRHHSATQRARTGQAEYVRQGYEARRRVADLHEVADTEREFARRFAWWETASYLGVDPERLPHALPPAAHAAAIAFDPQFDARATNPAIRAWDCCDAFFEASGAFAETNQRRLPVMKYNTWSEFVFRAGSGRMRLDPIGRAGRCELRRLTVRDSTSGHALWTADAANGFSGITTNPGVQLACDAGMLAIQCAHDDPQLFLPDAAGAASERFDLVAEIRYPLE